MTVRPRIRPIDENTGDDDSVPASEPAFFIGIRQFRNLTAYKEAIEAMAKDEETTINVYIRQIFSLAHHPTRTTPAFERLIPKILKYTSRLMRLLEQRPGLFQRDGDLTFEPCVLGQPQYIIHMVKLAPSHDGLSAETTIATNDNSRIWPSNADS